MLAVCWLSMGFQPRGKPSSAVALCKVACAGRKAFRKCFTQRIGVYVEGGGVVGWQAGGGR